jgi:hypothetical protein
MSYFAISRESSIFNFDFKLRLELHCLRLFDLLSERLGFSLQLFRPFAQILLVLGTKAVLYFDGVGKRPLLTAAGINAVELAPLERSACDNKRLTLAACSLRPIRRTAGAIACLHALCRRDLERARLTMWRQREGGT